MMAIDASRQKKRTRTDESGRKEDPDLGLTLDGRNLLGYRLL